MPPSSTNRTTEAAHDDVALGLRALVWILAEPDRADRLLALTGLDPAELRARAGEPTLLAAVLAFLAGHEPDLVACAEAIGEKPGAIVDAARRLEG